MAFAAQRFTMACFCSGRTSASTSSMPSWRATAMAVVRLSPVSITIRMPSCAKTLQRSFGVVALMGSATAMTPAALPSMATNMAVATVAAAGRRRGASGAAMPSHACSRPGCRAPTLRPWMLPTTPLPVTDVEVPGDVGSRRAARRAPRRRWQDASGCSLARSTPAALRSRSPREARRPTTTVTAGACLRSGCRSCRRRACRPSPSVPGLRRS
jgi:hypothetical protein